MKTLLIPTALRGFVDGKASVEVSGATVGETLADLTKRYPGLKRHLYEDDGGLRSFINVYVGEDNVKALEGLDTPVADGAELMLGPAIAGGHGGGRSNA
jgi:molybdopterin converting factor small subunit